MKKKFKQKGGKDKTQHLRLLRLPLPTSLPASLPSSWRCVVVVVVQWLKTRVCAARRACEKLTTFAPDNIYVANLFITNSRKLTEVNVQRITLNKSRK